MANNTNEFTSLKVIILFLSTFSIYGQNYKTKTSLLESLSATELAKDIAQTANKKLIWHKFNNYKEDDHMHEYYILPENKKDDFIFYTNEYDCANCLHIDFKPENKKMVLYRISGNEIYLNKIWVKYFNNADKSKSATSRTFFGNYKFTKEKYVWVIKKIK